MNMSFMSLSQLKRAEKQESAEISHKNDQHHPLWLPENNALEVLNWNLIHVFACFTVFIRDNLISSVFSN
jgi:hypothetical protein